MKDFLFHSIRVKQEFTYKGRIDGDSYYTMYVNLIRACKKVLYQLVYIVKEFVFLEEPLYLINQ